MLASEAEWEMAAQGTDGLVRVDGRSERVA